MWKAIDSGTPGNYIITIDNKYYMMIKDNVDIEGSMLIGYIYKEIDTGKDYALVAENTMYRKYDPYAETQ